MSIRLVTRIVPANMYFHCGNVYGTIHADLNEKQDRTVEASFKSKEHRLLTAHIVPVVEHRPRKVTRSVVKWKAMCTSLGQLRVALSHRELRSEPRYSVLLPLMIRDFVWVCGYEHIYNRLVRVHDTIMRPVGASSAR